MRRSLSFGMLALSLGLASSTLASPLVDPNQVAQFPTARAAQQHCPTDKVVWLDTLARRYYSPNSKRYGKTLKGAYVCKKELKWIGK